MSIETAFITPSPQPNLQADLPAESSHYNAEIFERFQSAPVKVALQKDGELTDISRRILAESFDIVPPARAPGERRLIDVSEDGQLGFVYARNKAICSLVGSGAVNMAVVGTDRLIEDGGEDTVDILASYQEQYSWPLLLATRSDSAIDDVRQISRVASQYSTIAARYFAEIGMQDVEIVPTAGGTELYPYIGLGGRIDAVVDMSVTGASLRAHNLTPWTPAISQIYPVLIGSRAAPAPDQQLN